MKYIPTKPTGLVCPRCGCRHIPVAGTYRIGEGTIRRYRECRHCGRRFTTTESTLLLLPPEKKSKKQ